MLEMSQQASGQQVLQISSPLVLYRTQTREPVPTNKHIPLHNACSSGWIEVAVSATNGISGSTCLLGGKTLRDQSLVLVHDFKVSIYHLAFVFGGR